MKRRFVTEAMRIKMRELEAEGKSRKEIANLLNVEPPTVTRHLGPVRPYRGLRVPSTA
jgi:DNA-binding CsgD family transcriptional regulator